jgi:hypothetical protein
MVRSGLLRDGQYGFGASALALARRQGAAEFMFENGARGSGYFTGKRPRRPISLFVPYLSVPEVPEQRTI